MKFLLLGAGKMGRAIGYDLIKLQSADRVIVANRHLKKAVDLKNWLGTDKVEAVEADVTDTKKMVELMRSVDCVVSAVSYQYNYQAARAAVSAGVHYCDLGQNIEIVDREFTLSKKAEAKGITLIPDGGLAPGMVNIIAAHGIKQFESVDTVQLRVGGLPEFPKPPLNYNVTWSVHGLINEYVEKARILKNGDFLEVESLSEIEDISFPYPFNRMEAFITSGGTSTLPRTFQGKIRELNYKTIRYPNHCHIMKAFIDLGFAGETPIHIGGKDISPRRFFEKILNAKLKSNQVEDVVLLRVTISGTNRGKREQKVYELIDYYDPDTGLTAMMRTTGFSLAVVAGLLAEGKIKKHGVLTQEESIPTEIYLSELERRGIKITERDGR